MSIPSTENTEKPNADPSKPRIAIMGEFSVGKSTLCNLLIGAAPLPVKVTATQLPPVWISHGTDTPYREDLDGNQTPIDLDKIGEVPLAETAFVRIFIEADILEMCDLIDMPGISDPNMSSEVWENVIPHADGVLWCTHATQAWRQSEAAVWKTLSETLYENSLLLITRMDKILSDWDQQRVLNRVRKETADLFHDQFPLSLTGALHAEDDREKWVRSGAEAFSQSLVDLIHKLNDRENAEGSFRLRITPESQNTEDSNVFRLGVSTETEPAPENVQPEMKKIMPIRVKVAANTGRPTRRPERTGS